MAAVAAVLLATGSAPIVHEVPMLVGRSSDSVRTLCVAGAFRRADGGNPALAQLCSQLPGLVHDCRDDCSSLFTIFSKRAQLDALVKSLDTDGDGDVDKGDKPLSVQLVGYSWGGVAVNDLAHAFVRDPRVAPERRVVDRMTLIDPFRPLSRVEVSEAVRQVHTYRQTGEAEHDCSRGSVLGPYVGLEPRCADGQCIDTVYDDVGHCRIVHRATHRIIAR